jgi:hypothetical protein
MNTKTDIPKKHVGRPATGTKRAPVNFNLPFDLIAKIEEFAAKHNVPKSSIAEKSLRIFFEYNS